MLLEEWGMETCNSVDNPISSKSGVDDRGLRGAPSGVYLGNLESHPEMIDDEDTDDRTLMNLNDAWKFRRGAKEGDVWH